MNLRTALAVIVGIIVAIAVVALSSSVVAGVGSSAADMVRAQRTMPVLWIVDILAVGIVAAAWWIALMSNHVQGFVHHQSTQHHDQLSEMIRRTLDLEQINDTYSEQIERLDADVTRRFRDVSDRISSVETATDARREVFEMESRRNAEKIHRQLQDQLDTHKDQVQAVGASLQFQRGELRRLRQNVRELQLSMPRANPLLPANYEPPAAAEQPPAVPSLAAASHPAESAPASVIEATPESVPSANAPNPSENPSDPPEQIVPAAASADAGAAALGSNGHVENGIEPHPNICSEFEPMRSALLGSHENGCSAANGHGVPTAIVVGHEGLDPGGVERLVNYEGRSERRNGKKKRADRLLTDEGTILAQSEEDKPTAEAVE